MLLSKVPTSVSVSYLGTCQPNTATVKSRNILITKNKMETKEMELKIVEFLNYLVLLSSTNLQLDKEQLESLIQGDFIEFGHFINL